jgi:hypothetical protein
LTQRVAFLCHTFGEMVSHRLMAGSAGILLSGLWVWSGGRSQRRTNRRCRMGA